MSNLKIEDEHHVSRYCKPSSIGEDGLPLSSAFRLRSKEEYLSVNWIEFFEKLDIPQAIDCVREVVQRKMDIKFKGRFVSMHVGRLKQIVSIKSTGPCDVIHLPTKNDESHSGVVGYNDQNRLSQFDIVRLIKKEDIYLGKLIEDH